MGKGFFFRSRVFLALMGLAVALFLWVLYDLQVVHGQEYWEQSTRKIANTETVEAARGAILDRYGRVLVDNRVTYRITIDAGLMGTAKERNATLLTLLDICRDQGVSWNDSLPVTGTLPLLFTTDSPFETVTLDEEGEVLSRRDTNLKRLCDALKLRSLTSASTAGEVVKAMADWFEVEPDLDAQKRRDLVGVLYELTLRSKDNVRTSYVFTQEVDIRLITAVKESHLAGVMVDTATVRAYHTSYAAHLLGQVGPITSETWDKYKDLGYGMSDTVGIMGVEQAFEPLLRGVPGVRYVELNQAGKVISESWRVDPDTGEEQAPQLGYNVTLTLDIRLQEAVERALARHIPGMTSESFKGACVITDMSGGILAAASYPSYDPADYYSHYSELSADPMQPLYNRALQGLYAPGSTIKMAVAAGGLTEGVITPREKILDTGRYRHYSRLSDQPMCWIFRQYGRTHGWENVSEAIRDSCNVYFYETGLRMGIQRLDKYCQMFGLGETTGLELYEAKGEIAGPESSERHGQPWYEGDTMYAAIGQGNTQVTPIQMANYITTLVNGGDHYATHLLKEARSGDFSQVMKEYQPRLRDTIQLEQEDLDAVKRGMGMLASEGSVAPYFRSLPVKVGAKTGTAQVARDSEANAILVAFAPYENPEMAISIVVERGGSGTSVAKIAQEILSYYFSSDTNVENTPQENTLIR